MSITKHFLSILAVAGVISNSLFAQDTIRGQETRFERQLKERDDKPLRDFVESKEGVDVIQKANNLDISGDVRFEYRNIHEKGRVIFVKDNKFGQKYKSLRGGNAVDFFDLPISNNDLDVEFNLKIKYVFENAWAMAQIQYDNSAGIRGFDGCLIPVKFLPDVSGTSSSAHGQDVALQRNVKLSAKGSGSADSINLKRAYMGYTIFTKDEHRLDIELGRRKFDDIFTSDIQFSSRFDGIILKFMSKIKDFSDFYWYGGPFMIDERVNHLGVATEIGVVNVLESGLDLRYSFVDWRKNGKNRCFARNPLGSEFMNSEISFSYNFEPEFHCVTIPAEFYAGVVMNHAAKKTIFTRNKRKNLGWYVGLYLGEVDKKGDWSFEAEYLCVQAQAISDFDVGAIGRGNILNERLTDMLYDPNGEIIGNAFLDESISSSSSSDNLSSLSESELRSKSSSNKTAQSVFLPRRGNANFRGWSFEFLYAITDNLTVDIVYEFSNPEDARIGGRHKFSVFKIESIYAF